MSTARAFCSYAPLVLATLAAILSGCHDPRVSLNEFLAMRDAALSRRAGMPASQPGEPATALLPERALPPYRVGPGDVLGVTLIGLNATTDATVLRSRVNREGEITLPLVGNIKVDGMEVEDVERAVTRKFIDEQIVKTLPVNVDVLTYDSTDVIIVGAVGTPGLLQLHRNERNAVHAVARANGFSEGASGRVTIRRLRQPSEERTFNLDDPVEVKLALAEPPLEPGDRVTVEAAAPNTVYTGGLLLSAGPRSFPPGTTINVLQLLASCGGVKEDVSPREATLIRHMPDGKDIQVKINIERVQKGKDPNILLAAGDIFWVPETAETRFWDFINKHVSFSVGVGTSFDPIQFERYGRLERQQEWNQRNAKRAAYLNPLAGVGSQQIINPFNFLGFTATPITPITPAAAAPAGGS